MTEPSPRKRRFLIALGLVTAGLLAMAVAVLAIWNDTRLDARPEVSGPVLPGWSQLAAEAARIEIVSAGESFALERREGGWVMPGRGDYPVRPERIAALDAGLGGLEFDRAMTRDPDKFARLGLGDPQAGGEGVRLTVLSNAGERLADLVIGARRGEDGVYLRRATADRAYAASGAMPELAEVDRWLGLDFLDLDPSTVARAQIAPETGPDYQLIKPGLSARNFDLYQPRGWRLVTAGAGNGVAVAGARVRFRDVRAAGDLDAEPVAGHAAVLFDGLAYAYTFYAEGETRWARIEVTAASDDAAQRAAELQSRIQGYVFEVSADAYERMTRPLNQLAEPVSLPAPE